MLRSLLVLLNDTERAYGALDLALVWAKSHNARLAGIGVLDADRICGTEAVPIGGMAYKEQRDAALLEEARVRFGRAIDRFHTRCAQASVTDTSSIEEGRTPDVLGLEAQRHDLILVDHPQSEPDLGVLTFDQLRTVVKHCPRPLVVVPDHPSSAHDVVIAYDGSLQAARAVQAFAQSGLAAGRDVRVISVSNGDAAATQPVDRAVEYLKWHGISAKAIPITSDEDPATVVLNQLEVYPAGLLVMGTFGQNVLREVLFGSVTRRLLERCPVPIFLSH